jgi:hypothetical protein
MKKHDSFMKPAILIAIGMVLVAAVVLASTDMLTGRDTSPHALSAAHEAGSSPSAMRPLSHPVTPASDSPRDEFLAIAERLKNSSNPYWGRGSMPELVAKIAAHNLSLSERANARALLMMEHLRLGDIDAGLTQINAAIADVESQTAINTGSAELLRLRALAHLRQAEVQNCVQRHNRDCCIFPLQGGAVHAVREPALKAKADLVRYLDLLPPNSQDARRQQRVSSGIWLLNIVCMALDEYPDGVPAQYRIPPAAFESEYDIGRFIDVAPQLGVDSFDLAGGTIVDDFDNDGLMDIVSSTCDPSGPLKAFRGTGDGTFEDVAAAWRLDEQLGGLNIVSADYNNDGRLDILVLRGAWMFQAGEMRNSLLRNNPDGTFTDVTREAGLVEPIAPTQAAVWADFDNDGWLDLYVGNESQENLTKDGAAYPSALYRNNQDGSFTDVTRSAGVANQRYCKGVAAGDYDNDGDMDLYVSNIGPNRLYRNNGNMTFTDVAARAHVTRPEERSFATWFFDFDNDGWLDIWVGGYNATIADLTRQAVGALDDAVRPRLYRNTGDGSFMDVTETANLDRVFLPMGANYGDFDNDGWLDIYLGTGDPSYDSLMPNVALRNDRGRRFQDISQSAGLGHLQKGHGIAFVDIDNDGDQDIYHQLGAFYPGDKFRNGLYINPGQGNHFVSIELIGTMSNRMAVGTRVKVTIIAPEGRRELYRSAGCVSSFGGSPRRLEIGLEKAAKIDSIEVWWPTSRIQQRFTDVPLDSFIRVTEGDDEFVTLTPGKLKLGAQM